MRRSALLVLLCGLALTKASKAVGLELELAPGFAVSKETGVFAPAVRPRLGLLFPHFTASLVGFGAFTADARASDSLQLWALAVEGRLHSEGKTQVSGGFAVGVGSVVIARSRSQELTWYGPAAPYVEGLLGVRHRFEEVSIGLDASVQAFNQTNVDDDRSRNNGFGAFVVFGVRATLGFSVPGL